MPLFIPLYLNSIFFPLTCLLYPILFLLINIQTINFFLRTFSPLPYSIIPIVHPLSILHFLKCFNVHEI